jgi:CspA family cold shock protein
MNREREQGAVVSWDQTKGIGQVKSDRGEALWVHFSFILQDGFRALSPGQRVEFIVVESPGPPDQRLQAHQVVPLG